MSETSGPIGSVASSAAPVFDTTVETSGIRRNARSAWPFISIACVSETEEAHRRIATVPRRVWE